MQWKVEVEPWPCCTADIRYFQAGRHRRTLLFSTNFRGPVGLVHPHTQACLLACCIADVFPMTCEKMRLLAMQDVTLSLRGDLDMRHPKFNAFRAQQACVSLHSVPLKITGTQVRSSHRTKFEKNGHASA